MMTVTRDWAKATLLFVLRAVWPLLLLALTLATLILFMFMADADCGSSVGVTQVEDRDVGVSDGGTFVEPIRMEAADD